MCLLKVCPNCSEVLQPEERLLGRSVDWLKCNECGYREEDEESDDNFISDLFYDEGGEYSIQDIRGAGKD